MIAAGAALGAALFAFISALINARVQSENAELQARTAARIKLAQFRQEWINRLRENFVTLQVKIAQNPTDLDREVSEDIFRILLMMNKEDVKMPTIKKLVGDALKKGDESRAAQIDLLGIFQDIIKGEWEVVKDNLGADVKK
jgi:hypothetical protein